MVAGPHGWLATDDEEAMPQDTTQSDGFGPKITQFERLVAAPTMSSTAFLA